MPWRGPEYEGDFPSLGWNLLAWIKRYLVVPSGPLYGQPLEMTDEQASFLVRYYRVDEHGRFVYRRAAQRRVKGWGKSPGAGAVAVAEFCGPVVFDGWSAAGEPVGRQHHTPWVQVAACSEDQAGNTYSALHEMLRQSPAVDEYGIDLGITRVHFKNKPGRLEPVTASAGSREGQPITAAVLDETHLWLPSNGGKRLANTIRRNAGKMNARTFETTNAFEPGEGSVAEDTHHAAEKNTRGLLYDAVEAPWVEDLGDREALLRALGVAYGDAAKWVDLNRVVEEIQDPATNPSDARRFYLNQLVKSDRAGIDPASWRPLHRDWEPPAGARVAIGFDGSQSQDATALVGCCDGHLFEIRMWERRHTDPADWRVPRGEVEAEVERCFDRWDVGRMLCDPPRWQSDVERWMARWNPAREADAIVLWFDTNQPRRMAAACDRFVTAITEGSVTWSGDRLGAHVLAMARKKARLADDDDDGRTRFLFVKADARKIDGGIAAVLALEGFATMPPAPAPREFFGAWA